MMTNRGYFEIGVFHGKTQANIGTLMRSAWQLGAAGVFTIGQRYRRQASDTINCDLHVPLRHYLTFDEFYDHLPHGAMLVGIEMGGKPLRGYAHPIRAVYLLGAEDHGLPNGIQDRCHSIVALHAVRHDCFNVAVAGSIVMHHRVMLG